MAKELLLGHITDLHYPVYTAFRPRDLLTKRITGGINLLFSSRRKFRPHLFTKLLQNFQRIGVDHVVVTGDLVNLGYKEEFEAVRSAFVENGFGAERVTIVPGNHDVYLPECVEKAHFWRALGPYAKVAGPQEYPFITDLGGVLLVGLSSAIPSQMGFAYGALGERQLERLERLLQEHQERPRILLIHHPPYVGHDSFDDGLTDGVKLRKLVWQYGVDLVLHGHEHQDLVGTMVGPRGACVPVLGTGCAILSHSGHGDHARARLLRFEEGKMTKTWVISHNKKTGHWRPVA